MDKDEIIKPLSKKGKCPHCDIYREWYWDDFISHYVDGWAAPKYYGAVAHCDSCDEYIIYYKEKMIYPKNLSIKPNALFDKYQKSKKLFLEAVEVAPISPRAGHTLSRMCLESLTNEILEEKGQKIDEEFYKKVEKLYELKIIDEKIKEYMSDVRVIGNKANHNFNIIDTDCEPIKKDAELVLEIIDYILKNIQTFIENDKKLSELREKIKTKEDSTN